MVSCHIFNNYLLIASLNTILIAAVPSELKLINVVSVLTIILLNYIILLII